MENYIVDLDGDGFSPDEFADIKKCLETLLSVRAGSQPLDREFGIDVDHEKGYPRNNPTRTHLRSKGRGR